MANQREQVPITNGNNTDRVKDRWIRGAYIVLFFIIAYILRLLIMAVGILQFLSNVIFEKSNTKLLNFGQSLSIYAYDIIRFISYNSDQKPYPFSAWPSSNTSNGTVK